MPKVPRLAPSILNADFARLGEEVAAIEPVADWLHIDVMDGHFVPNISFGLPIIRALRPHSKLYFDCHLMTTNPDAYFDDLAAVGVDLVTVHLEVFPDPTAAAAAARAAGLAFGLVLNPPTPLTSAEPFLELCDVLLIMSVNPGFGGQSFITETLEKIAGSRKMVDSQGLATDIEVDGGINPTTAIKARDAGADVFVAGSAIFGSADPGGAAQELKDIITNTGSRER